MSAEQRAGSLRPQWAGPWRLQPPGIGSNAVWMRPYWVPDQFRHRLMYTQTVFGPAIPPGHEWIGEFPGWCQCQAWCATDDEYVNHLARSTRLQLAADDARRDMDLPLLGRVLHGRKR